VSQLLLAVLLSVALSQLGHVRVKLVGLLGFEFHAAIQAPVGLVHEASVRL